MGGGAGLAAGVENRRLKIRVAFVLSHKGQAHFLPYNKTRAPHSAVLVDFQPAEEYQSGVLFMALAAPMPQAHAHHLTKNSANAPNSEMDKPNKLNK